MKLEVHIKDKIFPLSCGEGGQKIKWIADAAVVRYEHFYAPLSVNPLAVSTENGSQLDLEHTIRDTLNSGDNVWIMFKEDLEAIGIVVKPKKRL